MKNKIDKSEFIQNLLKTFEQISPVSFKKGHILTGEGCIENNLYYIEEGAVKIYYQSELNEHIIRLGYNGSILNSLTSFFNQEPSELVVETLRESQIKVLKRSEVMEIKNISNGYQTFLEKLLIQQLEREIDLLQDSPNKRLERVLKRSPQLFQHVPLKYIASYLRMSPETLSRIRKS
ncbi:Crp/Fnr family transcriptional regulator [Seonamhaeicola sp. NFXS20]|uniref:Crp/Fnr family transcriptional regulator n=1 Tax=Seonamhaeicola sp. NFXS20 TaxID=2816959 RepID=UPI003B8E22D0